MRHSISFHEDIGILALVAAFLLRFFLTNRPSLLSRSLNGEALHSSAGVTCNNEYVGPWFLTPLTLVLDCRAARFSLNK